MAAKNRRLAIGFSDGAAALASQLPVKAIHSASFGGPGSGGGGGIWRRPRYRAIKTAQTTTTFSVLLI